LCRQSASRDGHNVDHASLVVTRRMLLVKPSVLPYNARKAAWIYGDNLCVSSVGYESFHLPQ
jgi:hypothetical protein